MVPAGPAGDPRLCHDDDLLPFDLPLHDLHDVAFGLDMGFVSFLRCFMFFMFLACVYIPRCLTAACGDLVMSDDLSIWIFKTFSTGILCAL